MVIKKEECSIFQDYNEASKEEAERELEENGSKFDYYVSFSQHEQEVSSLKSEIETLKKGLKEYKSVYDEDHNSIKDLREQISRLQKENSDLEKIKLDLFSERNKLENENKILKEEKSKLDANMKFYYPEAVCLKKENEELKIKNDNLETDINAVRIAAKEIISQKDHKWKEKIRKHRLFIDELKEYIVNINMSEEEWNKNMRELNIKED